MLAIIAAVLLAQSPDPSAEMRRGRSLVEDGELGAAREVFGALVVGYPTWALAHLELAEVMLREGGSDPAALDLALAAARQLDPANPRAWLLTGRAFEQRQALERAAEAFKTAAALRPDLAEAQERVGVLLVQAGRHAEAVAHLKVAVALLKDARVAQANLAEACEQTGDLAAAEALLQALAQAAPGPAWHRRLAQFYERNGQPERAEEEMRLALEGRPARNLRPLPKSKR